MRTTVDIPDPLYRELKSKAAQEGRSVKQVILCGIESQLRPKAAKSSTAKRKHISLPILKSKDPGTLHLDNERIFDLIGFH